MRILVTGGTGLVGNAMGRRLARAHQILALSREGKAAQNRVTYDCELVPWDVGADLSPRILEGVDAIIHLAGANIADGRWTDSHKKVLRESRLAHLEKLQSVLAASGRQPRVLISMSAVGYYGDRGDELLTENSSPGSDFLAQVCVDWEKAALSLGARRTVILRLGVVLAPGGGFVTEVTKMFKRFGAARLGSGRQYVSWVHVDDVVEVIAQSLANPSYSGVLNVTAPHQIQNIEMTDILAQELGACRTPPAPAFALKLLYGEMAGMLLASQRVSPERLRDLKMNFKYSDFKSAIQAILKSS